MKLNVFASFLLFFINDYFIFSTEIKTNLENHLKMLNKLKMKSKVFLETLYNTVNNVDEQRIMRKHKLNQGPFMVTNQVKRNLKRERFVVHKSFPSYEYRDYRNINKTMHDLVKQYPELVKLSTAQKDYNLPNPGGRCKEDR